MFGSLMTLGLLGVGASAVAWWMTKAYASGKIGTVGGYDPRLVAGGVGLIATALLGGIPALLGLLLGVGGLASWATNQGQLSASNAGQPQQIPQGQFQYGAPVR